MKNVIRNTFAFFLLVGWTVGLNSPACAEESNSENKVDYLTQIKPILAGKCYACHGALKQEADLRLETRALMLEGGDSGEVIAPGSVDESLLLERITAEGDDERMPPVDEGARLTAEEIALIRDWIRQGAIAPVEEIPADPADHWSFRAPLRTAVPQPQDAAWRDNPIDAFLAARQEKLGLVRVAPADKQTLLRRVYLDLIGLPPTRKELQAFAQDDSPQAYEKIVQRLLASPQYGERWGRHWMDVWRYADWYGLGAQLRNSQKHLWHWRDWIIESLNADKGYDQMVLEMLAADEIAPTDQNTLRATGYLARHYYLFNRTTWMDDTIEHTAKAFLGLTMNCTKCHDHKYDPIDQVDYYRFRAFFEPYQVRLDALSGETNLEKNGLPRIFDAHLETPTYLHIRGNEKDPDKNTIITPGVPKLLAFAEMKITPVTLPAAAHRPALQAFVLQDQLAVAERQIVAARGVLKKADGQLAAAQAVAKQTAAKQTAANQTAANQTAAANKPAAFFLQEDFSQARPDIWETVGGVWKYAAGKVVQSNTGINRVFLQTRQPHPADFVARLKFKILGGDRWKSVGVCFDVDESREKMVYLSAVSPGSKVQISYNQGRGHVYPAAARQDRPVALNASYEMTVSVRAQLVNVALNGKHVLAFHLPIAREPGQMKLVAFDAHAEFDSFEVETLPASVQLVAAGGAAPPTLDVAQAAAKVARLKMAAAELRPESLQTAFAADTAKFASPPAENSAELVKAAAIAARTYERAQAAAAVAEAEQKLAAADKKTKPKAEKALAAARSKFVAAEKAWQKPGAAYTSLRASRKALEGPSEKPASRDKPYPATSTGRRTALARWMIDRRNPLTARVAVNHIWLRHFGQPLVDSLDDFGTRAPQPVQHALLDWLAVEFMEHDWSMKHLHRLMVTSRAYQLSSSERGAAEHSRKQDPENQYYWRRRPTRMESQVIRDSLLHLAGVLNPALGGPTINPDRKDTVFRRSLYFTHSRDARHKFLSMFDDADIFRCYRRSESIVPQQALALANSQLALAMSRKIAAKLQQALGQPTDEQFIVAAFETVLAGRPTEAEQQACQEALAETRTLLASVDEKEATRRARENLVHVLLNHNDFVTVR